MCCRKDGGGQRYAKRHRAARRDATEGEGCCKSRSMVLPLVNGIIMLLPGMTLPKNWLSPDLRRMHTFKGENGARFA